MTNNYLKEVNPLQAFVEFVYDTKPYHSKIIEIHEEYIHEEGIFLSVKDSHFFGDPRCEVYPCHGDDCDSILEPPRGDWESTNYCQFKGIELIHPTNPAGLDPCLSGYSTKPYGSPDSIPILSPNPSVRFLDYPAIDTAKNTFKVLGDRVKDFRVGNKVKIHSAIEDFCNVDRVMGVEVDDSDKQYEYMFKINGNKTADYLKGFVFYADGLAYRKKYVVTKNATYDSGNDQTVISVYPSISEQDKKSIRYIGLTVTNTVNTGTYTIKSSELSGGNLPQWPDRTDAKTFKEGDILHTVVGITESFQGFPNINNDCQTIVSSASFELEPFNSVLHYSNYRNKYFINWDGVTTGRNDNSQSSVIELDIINEWGNPKKVSYVPLGVETHNDNQLVNAVIQTPDEGYYCTKILETVPTQYNGDDPIEGSGQFIIDGLLDASNVFASDTFSVLNSTDNPGTYTITAIDYDEENSKTTLSVKEIVRSDEVSGSTSGAKGFPGPGCTALSCSSSSSNCKDLAKFEIPSNVIIVSGNHTDRFVQGKQFIIDSGSLAGTYTTYNSRYLNGNTHIRTTVTLLEERDGFNLIEVKEYTGGYYGLVISENKDSLFEEGDYFNIINSVHNDGFYEVAAPGSTVIGLNKTEIPIQSDHEMDLRASGKVIAFKAGNIQERFYGYAEYDEWCENIPYTYVKVAMDERLELVGAGLNLKDNVILHNMENTDSRGYELPLATVFNESPADPLDYPNVLTISDSDPGSSTQFWFDTDPSTKKTERLKRYIDASPKEWVPTHSNDIIWWVRTTTNPSTGFVYYHELYYKKIYYDGTNPYTETSWIMDLPQEPGYPVIPGKNLIQPSRGNMKQLNVGSFIAPLSLSGEAQNTYEITDGQIGQDIYNLDEVVPDYRLLDLSVNGIPAMYEFTESTQVSSNPVRFDVTMKILSPYISHGDTIYYNIYERLEDADGWQHNAHVFTYDQEPYNKFFAQVQPATGDTTPEGQHGAYVVGGGNYLKNFRNLTSFAVHSLDNYDSVIRIDRTKNIPIISVDVSTRNITVKGNYEYLLRPGCVFMAQPSFEMHTVERALNVGGTTVITVEPFDFEDPIFYSDPDGDGSPDNTDVVDVVEIDNITDSVIVACDKTNLIKSGDHIEVINSSQGNDGVYIVNQSTFDFGLDQTYIRVVGGIPNNEVGSAQIKVEVFSSERTEYVVGAIYNPEPQDILYDDHGDPFINKTDATYIVPNGPADSRARKIDLEFKSPMRIETDYNIWDEVDVDAANNSFILRRTGQKIDYDYNDSPPTGSLRPGIYSMEHNLPPGSIFKIKHSSNYHECSPSRVGDNDGYYVVKSTSVAGTPKETTVIVEDDYSKLPPFGEFQINSTSNPAGIGGQIVFAGDFSKTITALSYGKFYMDSPLVSSDPMENLCTIANYYYNDATDETFVDVEETVTVIGAPQTINLVDYGVIPGVFFNRDEPETADLFHAGEFVWEGLQLDTTFEADDRLAKALISEKMSFQWGGEIEPFEYKIGKIIPEINTITVIKGSNDSSIQVGQEITVSETFNNNRKFTVESISEDDKLISIKVRESLAYGTITITGIADGKLKIDKTPRRKILRNSRVKINRKDYNIKNIKVIDSESFISFEESIADVATGSEIWFTERFGKVTDK